MNPDLGEHLWSTGLADKKVILVGADFQTIADAPKNTSDVSFHRVSTLFGLQHTVDYT
jgi:hypothetical protein